MAGPYLQQEGRSHLSEVFQFLWKMLFAFPAHRPLGDWAGEEGEDLVLIWGNCNPEFGGGSSRSFFPGFVLCNVDLVLLRRLAALARGGLLDARRKCVQKKKDEAGRKFGFITR